MANKEKNAESGRLYRAAHLEEKAETARRWRQANREKVNEINRLYRKANPEKTAEYSRRWRKTNPEKRTESIRRYYEANPEKFLADRYIRLARLAGVDHEPWVAMEIFERDDWTCQILECRNPDGRTIDPSLHRLSKWGAQIDHIIPISKGGPDTPANLQASHGLCNRAKGARIPNQ